MEPWRRAEAHVGGRRAWPVAPYPSRVDALPVQEWDMSRRTSPLLEVYLLGLMDYESAWQMQQRLVYEVGGAEGRLAALAVCEHPPLVTIGRSGSRSQLDCDDDALAALRLGVRWVNRGGGCMVHAPGQVVAYPIMPLHATDMGLAVYLTRLEHWVIATLDEFGLRATAGPSPGTICTAVGQVAAIGVAVTRGVAYHGVSINLGGPTHLFRILRPDNGRSIRVTTVEAARQRPLPVHRFREALVRHFVDAFELKHHQLFTSCPWLRSKRRDPAHATSAG
jgi:lipoyl(octanoyl) transferase